MITYFARYHFPKVSLRVDLQNKTCYGSIRGLASEIGPAHHDVSTSVERVWDVVDVLLDISEFYADLSAE